jgi:chromate transporter
VIGWLAAADGWDGTLAQMGLFFSQAALLTFGGAYAVLPYVYQGAVEHYGWLTGPQMIDGLALGETTPGPLIMVVAFAGYLGAGVAGALTATFFTFLPSFIFIFAGAPFVETTHGDLKFSAPLTGITAAVVGVIVNLALFFAWHVLWPGGAAGRFDWVSALVGAAAFVALFRFKVAIMPVIGACALVGLAITLLR